MGPLLIGRLLTGPLLKGLLLTGPRAAGSGRSPSSRCRPLPRGAGIAELGAGVAEVGAGAAELGGVQYASSKPLSVRSVLPDWRPER
ncbi:hypothetical protein [Micromonospora sp. NPDC049679]|uniref:hypothetical protein n=1 Tax=Micromonospora sp. NPDC049679 TaxID=3155920 RepID=UPI0033C72FE2